MKKILSVILCCALIAACVAGFSACSKEKEKETENSSVGGEVVGGWEIAESPEITKEFKEFFEKTVSDYVGMDFVPVAYLSSQVVAGTNHCILCEVTPVVQNAKTSYALVTVYKDLQGNSKVTDVVSCGFEVTEDGLDGGWTKCEPPVLTDEAKTALENASKTLTGAEFSPYALLSTQVAATQNYCILCSETATVPNAQSKWAIVTVAASDDKTAEIMDIYEFETYEEQQSEQEQAVTNAEE